MSDAASATSAALTGIALIGLDWGSTHLRAFALDANGRVIKRAQSAHGAMTLSGGAAFDHALCNIVGDWCGEAPAAKLIASGMVGAINGWVEARYVDLGATPQTMAQRLVSVPTSLGRLLQIVPGVKSDAPDVMRGEETQIVGSGVPDGVIVLPGTHSKWARVERGALVDFTTYFSGELNALIRQHSAVGKIFDGAPSLLNANAVERGIARARANSGAGQWLADLFSFRARVVTQTCSGAEASTEFSAWLVATEFMAASAKFPMTSHIHVIGDPALAAWYARIAEAFQMTCDVLNGEQCSARGLWEISRHH